MAIEVGQKLSLQELLAKDPIDRVNYIERLQVREYRELLDEIDLELSNTEHYKDRVIALKRTTKAVVYAQR